MEDNLNILIEASCKEEKKFGLNGSKIYLKFTKHNFQPHDKIGYDNQEYALYINNVQGNIVSGRIFSNDSSLWLPKKAFIPGTKWFNLRN